MAKDAGLVAPAWAAMNFEASVLGPWAPGPVLSRAPSMGQNPKRKKRQSTETLFLGHV